ncbi:MAG: hypothetical protein EPO21_07375 [Chloroflexota bacterium]|nr:MAG: hypothetical protein EPO21_07375 [Chloroflexota bacterium]
MHHYRQVLARQRQGNSDRDTARNRPVESRGDARARHGTDAGAEHGGGVLFQASLRGARTS